MAAIVKIDADYRAWMEQIIERYRSSQIKAAVKVKYNQAVENHPQLVGNSSEPNHPQSVSTHLLNI